MVYSHRPEPKLDRNREQMGCMNLCVCFHITPEPGPGLIVLVPVPVAVSVPVLLIGCKIWSKLVKLSINVLTLDFGCCGCCCCCCGCCCVMVGAECEGAMFGCLTREDAGGCWGTRNPSFFNTDPVDALRGMSAVACDAAAFGVSKLCCFIFCNNNPLCLWRC